MLRHVTDTPISSLNNYQKLNTIDKNKKHYIVFPSREEEALKKMRRRESTAVSLEHNSSIIVIIGISL